jgi:hypothetical protein
MIRVSMSDQRVLLIWQDAKERQAVYKILCATGAPVEFATVAPPPEKLSPYRLIVVDCDSAPEAASQLLLSVGKAKPRPAILAVTSAQERTDIPEILAHDELTNLVAKDASSGGNDLVVTAQKILRNDIFNLEKYLTWGAHTYEHVVADSEQRGPILDDFEGYLNRIGCNKRLITLARGVADEFITNAVYNAPVDRAGKPKYASRSRTERVFLQSNEQALFRYACDGRTLALSIRDSFGRLERNTIRSYLQKGFRKGSDQVDKKDGGAGLGLYYIFESLNQLVINLAPNRCTELIGLMDISGTYRDFAQHPKSLNIFTEEATR